LAETVTGILFCFFAPSLAAAFGGDQVLGGACGAHELLGFHYSLDLVPVVWRRAFLAVARVGVCQEEGIGDAELGVAGAAVGGADDADGF
jgi:hypothetical protein